MSDATRLLANLAVERLQEYDWGRTDVRVHWDDCDMDERRFWIHIRVPGIDKLTRKDKDSFLVRDISHDIQTVTRSFKKGLEDSDYEAVFTRESSPRRVYRRKYDSLVPWSTEFAEYDSNTWVYILSLYGG